MVCRRDGAFAIAPNDQDKTFSSPDGKYILRAFDENTNTPAELTDYSLIVISDAETGKVLYEGKKMYRNTLLVLLPIILIAVGWNI